jgi:hypothetical protein
MAIITNPYFIGKISIPTDNSYVSANLSTFIDRTEKQYLIDALGYELYKGFIAYVANPSPSVQRYDDILDGAEFTNSYGNLDKWDGLKDETTYISMLAYFTFYEFSTAHINETGKGTTVEMWENAEKISPIEKQLQAYNLGIEHYHKLYDFLLQNESDYSEWVYTHKDKLSILSL